MSTGPLQSAPAEQPATQENQANEHTSASSPVVSNPWKPKRKTTALNPFTNDRWAHSRLSEFVGQHCFDQILRPQRFGAKEHFARLVSGQSTRLLGAATHTIEYVGLSGGNCVW